MALDYNTIQLSGTGSLVTEELTNGATLTITKTGGIQDITGSLTPHGTQTLLLFEVANGLSNQVPGLNKSDFALVDAGGVKLNTVYSTTNFGFLLPKGTYNSGTFTIATNLPTIPANTLRIRAIGVKRSGTNMVELDGAGAPIYNNQYSFYFDQTTTVIADKQKFETPASANLSPTNNFTISAWAKPSPPSDPLDDGTIFDNANSSNGFLLMHDDYSVGGTWNFQLLNSTGPSGTNGKVVRVRSSIAPTTNWQNIIGVFLDGTGSIYIDGEKKGEEHFVSSAVVGAASVNPRIGASHGGTASTVDPYSGSLQNISLWNVAFDQNDIDELYNGGTPTDLNNHSQILNAIVWWQLGGNGESGSFDGTNWTELNVFNNSKYELTSDNMVEANLIENTP